MNTALLQTTYFGPIQWYQKLYRSDHCLIEQYDSFQKQTYRNRCIIATANGLQALTVPVEHTNLSPLPSHPSPLVKDLRISDHNQWRRVHWNALQSAYSESPFFEYYADDLHSFFEKKYDFLIDFNEAIRKKICELIDIHPQVEYTSSFLSPLHLRQPILHSSRFTLHSPLEDLRDVIHAKHPQPDADFQPKEYWQVFRHKHGFLPNLSILDLLFCMGPEAIFYL
ncbi:MAG: WbqC family protein [Bacteroidaceae bacterium]|nr:WbqC family protein [Bacteroidaceae bacterium]